MCLRKIGGFRSAMKARTQAANQLHSLVITCPEPLRALLRPRCAVALAKVASRFRPGPLDGPETAAKLALRSLARRYLFLSAEIADLDRELDVLVAEAAPALLEMSGVGTDVAGALLVAAGDNPDRLGSEASFARLCGAAPLPASSGKTSRHRLNRGGGQDREQRTVEDRLGSDAIRREDPVLRGAADQGGAVEEGDHQMPETLRGPGRLPLSGGG
jgi:transposase